MRLTICCLTATAFVFPDQTKESTVSLFNDKDFMGCNVGVIDDQQDTR